ncbi:hypothetical protein [Xanthobacter oligotrophicus]|uniref:hypothetical protein n=1 Tax=Xanthobacter oligotrophicus TaxID=2607286 RepID=UPI0011F3CF72|nr:hypothetical protein [Xanthobacter oligotrophicus]MCG5235299.1 hypothetical protein [Xanthobacter oligotrophicus]
MNVSSNDMIYLRVFSLIRPVPADATVEEIELHMDRINPYIARPSDERFANVLRTSLADCEKRLIEA